MLIINADDFGRSRLATDRILSCFRQGSVTSTSAMVFMEDSARAAELAGECGIDAGLHLNFTEKFTQSVHDALFSNYHNRIAGFLTRNNYNLLIYHPALRKQFHYVCRVQFEEFKRLYGVSPSHVDGHHHMHLCANMLVEPIIPRGLKVRRNFSFSRGEKSLPNRLYRALVDRWLGRRYLTPDYLFSLPQCLKTGRLERALGLAESSNVELETHPELTEEFEWLTGDACAVAISNLRKGSYAQLEASTRPGNNRRKALEAEEARCYRDSRS